MDSDRPSLALQRAGLFLIAGVIVAIISNINPIVAVYAAPDLLTGIAMIAHDRVGWALQQCVFLVGLLLTTSGLIVLAGSLLATRGYRLARAALVAIVAATGIWAVIVAIRLAVPAADLRQVGDIPPLFVAAMNGWLFQLFNLLMLGALAVYGGALLRSGWPRWLGLTTIILSCLLLVGFVIVGDGPPEMLCLVTLIVGIAALRRGLRRATQRQPAARG